VVQEAVKQVVLSWAQAPDFLHANQVLSTARENLSVSEFKELQNEIAEINVESFVQLIASKKETDEEDSTTVEGVALNPQQLKRISAWISDQTDLALALDLELSRWTQLVEQKMKNLFASVQGANTEATADISAAQKLLGAQDNSHFQERVESGKGFASLLSARNFKKK